MLKTVGIYRAATVIPQNRGKHRCKGLAMEIAFSGVQWKKLRTQISMVNDWRIFKVIAGEVEVAETVMGCLFSGAKG